MSNVTPAGWRTRLAALAGLLASSLGALLPSWAVPHLWTSPLDPLTAFAAFFQGANIMALLSSFWGSKSDGWVFLKGRGAAFFCGNSGAVGSGDQFRLMAESLVRMNRVLMGRGAQTVGFAVNGLLIIKSLIVKRVWLPDILRKNLRWAAFLGGIKGHPAIVFIETHVRFATSAPPTNANEGSHPYLAEQRGAWWKPWARDVLWEFSKNYETYQAHRRTVTSTVTGNGDFDYLNWDFCGKNYRLAEPEAREWLRRLGSWNSRSKVDTDTAAGVVGLGIAQGSWFASLRWVALHRVASGYHWTPPKLLLQRTARSLDAVFRNWLEGLPSHRLPDNLEDLHAVLLKEKDFSGKMQDLRQAVYAALPPELKAAGGDVVADDLLTAFFTHDGAFALREFHRCFEGTSGMVLATSLQPGEQFISTKNQTMAVALDPSAAAPVYLSSDPSALRAALLEDGRSPRYMFLMRDCETIRVIRGSDHQPTKVCLWREGVKGREEIPVTAGRLETEAAYAGKERFGGVIDMNEPWLELDLPNLEESDPTKAELRRTPEIFWTITRNWDPPGIGLDDEGDSRDRLTADSLLTELEDVMTSRDHAQGGLHLLVVGEELSAQAGAEFVGVVKGLLPGIAAEAMTGDDFIKNPGAVNLAPGTVCLVLSQSGQSFSALSAIKGLLSLERTGRFVGKTAVVTGQTFTDAGALLQDFRRGAPWSGRIISTHSGKRLAEPATASYSAMRLTLFHLAARWASRTRILKTNLSPVREEALRKAMAGLVGASEEDLDVDVTRAGNTVDRPGREWSPLETMGREIARGWLEPFYAGKVFVPMNLTLAAVASKVFGVDVIAEAVSAAVPNAWESALAPLLPPETVAILSIVSYILAFVVYFYFFAPLTTYAVRVFTGRWVNLRDRTGNRPLVVSSPPATAYGLQQFFRKATGLFFPSAMPSDIQSGTPNSEVHEFLAYHTAGAQKLNLTPPAGSPDKEGSRMAARQTLGAKYLRRGAVLFHVGLGETQEEYPRTVLRVDLPIAEDEKLDAFSRSLVEKIHSIRQFTAAARVLYAAAAWSRDVQNLWIKAFRTLLWCSLAAIPFHRFWPRYVYLGTKDGVLVASTAIHPAKPIDPVSFTPLYLGAQTRGEWGSPSIPNTRGHAASQDRRQGSPAGADAGFVEQEAIARFGGDVGEGDEWVRRLCRHRQGGRVAA
ncbi:MAG: hypothetical protein ACREXW_04835 [Gammaproteobacteria bacterium]